MRKILVFSLLLAVIGLSGCLPKSPKAALQINTNPAASVFINGKLVGKTPFTNREINQGEITLKLIPESTQTSLSSWEGKLKLVGGVMSVVSRDFAENDENSSGDILTLEPTKDKKNASLAVVTSPDGAVIKMDGENRGFSPLILDKIDEGDHQITLSLPEYKERSIKAKAVVGYKLILNSKMAKDLGSEEATPTGALTPTVTGNPKTTPTPKLTVAPKLTITPRPTVAITGGSVQIKGTPDGWLRVRSGSSTSSTEITRVNEGEKYPLVEEKSGWYKIVYEEGKEGWISSQYAVKVE